MGTADYFSPYSDRRTKYNDNLLLHSVFDSTKGLGAGQAAAELHVERAEYERPVETGQNDYLLHLCDRGDRSPCAGHWLPYHHGGLAFYPLTCGLSCRSEEHTSELQ